MLQARERQRDGEDDLGSDYEVNLSWQGKREAFYSQDTCCIRDRGRYIAEAVYL
jgi:hypothetical protein